MKYKKIFNLLSESSDSKFVTKNGTLSVINQTQIMMKELKLSKTQKY